MKALFDFVLVTGDWAADGAPEPDAIAHRETSHIGKGSKQRGNGGYDGIRTCDPRIMSAML